MPNLTVTVPHTIHIVTTICFLIKSPEEGQFYRLKYRGKFYFLVGFFFLAVYYCYYLKQQDLDCSRSYISFNDFHLPVKQLVGWYTLLDTSSIVFFLFNCDYSFECLLFVCLS